MALGNALEKQVRTRWDICTIEHYLKEQIIVRSLRWAVAPDDGLEDLESMIEWLRFFNGVGLKLQELVLHRKKKKMNKLEAKINQLQTQLDLIKDSQQITDLNNRIKKRLEKVDMDTHKKKTKTFYRDLNDFKTKTIYSWQNATDRIKTETVIK